MATWKEELTKFKAEIGQTIKDMADEIFELKTEAKYQKEEIDDLNKRMLELEEASKDYSKKGYTQTINMVENKIIPAMEAIMQAAKNEEHKAKLKSFIRSIKIQTTKAKDRRENIS